MLYHAAADALKTRQHTRRGVPTTTKTRAAEAATSLLNLAMKFFLTNTKTKEAAGSCAIALGGCDATCNL